MLKNKFLGVYCGTLNTYADLYKAVTKDLGCYLTNHKTELVYGGGKQSLIGILAKSVVDNKDQIYGVIPKFLDKIEHGFEQVTELHYVDTMHELKQKMFQGAETFIILSGEFDKLKETFEIIEWKQVDLHHKSIIFININNYWDVLLNHFNPMVQENFIRFDDNDRFTVLPTVGDIDCFMLAEKSNQDNYVSKFAYIN